MRDLFACGTGAQFICLMWALDEGGTWWPIALMLTLTALAWWLKKENRI